jgi:hypothetical protein
MTRESRLGHFVLTAIAVFILGAVANPSTASAAVLPAKPAFARVVPVSMFEIDLNWRDKSTNEDGFQIERSTDRVHFQQIAQVLPNTKIYRDKNLFPGTKYFYRIRAFNAAGHSGYATESARTPAPPVPLSIAEWDSYLYVANPTNQDIVSVSAGAYHGLALKKDGTVIAWGDNTYGQAIPPTNLNGVVAISAGRDHSLALKNDGTVVGWGYDFGGGIATPPAGLSGVVAISAGDYHNLALKADGTVVGWGYNWSGETTPPADLSGVVEIAAGNSYSLALKSDGTVVGWGNKFAGAATPPTNLTSVVAIDAGNGLSTAIKGDGTVVTWGSRTYQTIAATTNLTNISAIALGEYDGLALNRNGTLFGWDFNFPGATAPDLGGSARAISVGGYHKLVLCTAPAAPSSGFATILSANQVRISWQDNSIDEKSFAIERIQQTENGPTTWTQIASVGPNVTNYVDSTVAAGTSFAYRVRAIGRLGTSPYCPQINILLAPLPAPEYIFITLGSSNNVALWWYYNFDVDGFNIQRAPDNHGEPGAWTEIASITDSGADQNSFADSTALPNNIYWYRVRAYNVLGVSDFSDPISFNVAPPPTPAYFHAFAFADSASLSWSYDSSAQGFKIERAPDVNGHPGPWTELATVAPSTTEFNDRGLSLHTTYWYRIRAFNWAGDSPYAGPAGVTIVPPTAPYDIYATVGLTNSVDIVWYPPINDQDGFKLERADDVGGGPGAWSEIASFNHTNSYSESFHDTNVVANSTYWYRVRAFNLFGFSDYSTPASVSLVPPPAPTLSAATSKADTVNLQWHSPTVNLLGFKIERAPDVDGVPGAWTQIATTLGFYQTYTDTNLTAGATYWYRIRSVNWIGDSLYSGLTVVTIDPPATPAITHAVLNQTNGVDLTLGHIVLGYLEGDQDGFLLERAVPTDLGFINWTQIAVVNSSRTVSALYTDTNATSNATNWYRVRTFNSTGISDYSPTLSIAVVPPAPPYVSVSAHADSATVTIHPNNFAAEAILGYRLQRAPDLGEGQPGTWTTIATIADTTYVDAGLTIGATYWYRAQAFNWVGDSIFGDPDGVTISPAGTPDAPFAWLSVTNHQVNLYWYDYFTDEDGFTIERAPDTNGSAGLWSQIGTIYNTNAFATDFSDTNVVANTTNWYRVRAFNTAGVSEYSEPANLAAIAPAPPVLSGNAFANVVSLSWYDGTASEASIAGYKLERAPDNNDSPGAWVQITNTPDTSYTDPGRAADTIYWYRVRSYNWIGQSDYSDTYGVLIMPPLQPSNLFAAVGTNHTVSVRWNDFEQDEDGFKIERVPDAGGYPGDAWVEIGTVNARHAVEASFVDTNVVANTTNWYRVRAFSGAGLSEYDGDAMVRVMPPDAPFETAATPFPNGIQVSWFLSFGIGNGGFVIQRAPDVGGNPGTWTDIATNTEFAMSYDDTGLTVGSTYWYRVLAFNWVGASDYGSMVSATVLGPPPLFTPATLSASPGLTNQVNLSWYDYASDEDGFKIQRAPDIGGAPGNWAEIGTIYATNYYFAGFTDTNVTANSTNWYRVQAFNSVGTSAFSDPITVGVIAPLTGPVLTGASVLGAHRVDIQWQTSSGFIQGYKVERAFDEGGSPGNWAVIADVPTSFDAAAYSDITVVMNKKYWYRVQTYNWAGSSPYSDPLFVNVVPPDAPLLTAVSDQANQIKLTWIKTADDISSYKIERAPDNNGVPGVWNQIEELYFSEYGWFFPTNYTDHGIPTGQTFWYRIRAVNAVGNSPYSNEASATAGGVTPALSALPTPPQILSVTPTSGGMLIEWSSTAGNTDTVQAADGVTGDYLDISPSLTIGGSGTITNYLDAGALTNASRFYRIRSAR